MNTQPPPTHAHIHTSLHTPCTGARLKCKVQEMKNVLTFCIKQRLTPPQLIALVGNAEQWGHDTGRKKVHATGVTPQSRGDRGVWNSRNKAFPTHAHLPVFLLPSKKCGTAGR